MKNVRKIQIINGEHSQTFIAWSDGIGDIVEKSQEFEDRIYQMTLCYNEKGKLIKRIENCPVIIDYVIEEGE